MDKKQYSVIFLVLILLSFFILTFLIIAVIFIKIEDKSNNQNKSQNIVSNVQSDLPYKSNIVDILKKHNSEYISQELNTVYVKFGEDLYSKDGKSNEEYFYKLIEDMKQFLKEQVLN